MVGPSPWRNHNYINLHIFAFFAIFGEQNFCGSGHTAQPTGINRRSKVNGFCPCLYLDKGDALSAPCD
jgi:hypothetical protein